MAMVVQLLWSDDALFVSLKDTTQCSMELIINFVFYSDLLWP